MSDFSTWAPLTQGIPGSGVIVFSAVTPDNLVTITTAGYLNDLGNKTKLNDVWFINYADTSTQPLGENATLGMFKVITGGGNTSLSLLSATGSVELPFVVGNFLSAATTTGGIKDSAITPSAPAQPIVASVSSSTIIGNLAAYSDIAGTINDSGIVADEVLVSGFASPDTNANIVTSVAANITNASIVSGVSIFIPTGSTSYTLLGGILTTTQAFAGGSNNSNLNLTIANLNTGTPVITATSAAIKATIQSYALGQAGFAFSGLNIPITAVNSLWVKADTGSDYTGGIASITFIMVRTA